MITKQQYERLPLYVQNELKRNADEIQRLRERLERFENVWDESSGEGAPRVSVLLYDDVWKELVLDPRATVRFRSTDNKRSVIDVTIRNGCVCVTGSDQLIVRPDLSNKIKVEVL